jgi:hypothetical protein
MKLKNLMMLTVAVLAMGVSNAYVSTVINNSSPYTIVAIPDTYGWDNMWQNRWKLTAASAQAAVAGATTGFNTITSAPVDTASYCIHGYWVSVTPTANTPAATLPLQVLDGNGKVVSATNGYYYFPIEDAGWVGLGLIQACYNRVMNVSYLAQQLNQNQGQTGGTSIVVNTGTQTPALPPRVQISIERAVN